MSSLRFSTTGGSTEKAENSSFYPTTHLPSSDLLLNFEVGSKVRGRRLTPSTMCNMGSPPPNQEVRDPCGPHFPDVPLWLLVYRNPAEWQSQQAASLPWQVNLLPGDALGHCLMFPRTPHLRHKDWVCGLKTTGLSIGGRYFKYGQIR